MGRLAPVVVPYLDSGSAIKGERLDLSVLKENLQHIWNQEKSFLLQHVLGEQEGARPPTE